MKKPRTSVIADARLSALEMSIYKPERRPGGSKIEWTDFIFNPWWGCRKVSAACKHCYAEATAKRYFRDGIWGKGTDRRLLSDAHWTRPLRWNRQAEAAGTRLRVFCASMADVFEGRSDLDVHRARLWELIEATPHLDWQLLTKRPQNIMRMVPWGNNWPANVWIGTTVENQKAADKRLSILVDIPAVVRFISAEPLFTALDLAPWIDRLDWVITGGESGGNARPGVPAHITQLRDQCVAARVAFFFKQWGEFAPEPVDDDGGKKTIVVAYGTTMVRLKKAAAGRVLDGRTWNEFPTPRRHNG